MGVLLALRLPVLAGRLLRGRVLPLRLPRLDPPVAQGDEQQRAHQDGAPSEAAVPEYVGEFLADDVADAVAGHRRLLIVHVFQVDAFEIRVADLVRAHLRDQTSVAHDAHARPGLLGAEQIVASP